MKCIGRIDFIYVLIEPSDNIITVVFTFRSTISQSYMRYIAVFIKIKVKLF